MIWRVLVATAFATLVIASVADAAMCIRLSTQATKPVVGHATIIEMKTLTPLVSGGLKPVVVRDYPFRVQAVSPRGRAFRLAVKPSQDPYVWRGTFRFASAGMWTLRVTNFGPSYPAGCGAQLHVRVRKTRDV